MSTVALYIEGSKGIYAPIIYDGIELETQREGSPAKLTFTLVKDQIISFPEGAPVNFFVDGKPIFKGYVFQKSRDKEHHIQCVAYDQLRYFKNTHNYVFPGVKASDILKRIIEDFRSEDVAKKAEIDDTEVKINLNKYDSTLFDIILCALNSTTAKSGKKYVLYDDFGVIKLKNMDNLHLNLLIDNETAENFDYTSSIDDDTYNRIVINVEDENSTEGKKVLTPHWAQDTTNIKCWGVLQYSETFSKDSSANFDDMAKNLLKLKNRKTRHLEVKGVLGDINVRAGCSLPVYLNIGDIRTQDLQKTLVCDRVIHRFNENNHTMDIIFWDGDTFVG